MFARVCKVVSGIVFLSGHVDSRLASVVGYKHIALRQVHCPEEVIAIGRGLRAIFFPNSRIAKSYSATQIASRSAPNGGYRATNRRIVPSSGRLCELIPVRVLLCVHAVLRGQLGGEATAGARSAEIGVIEESARNFQVH
jgi:hypothetical protein